MSNSTPIVFIVDADMSVRIALDKLLRRAGWKPELFPSTDQFLAHAAGSVPACLLLDGSILDLTLLDELRRIAATRPEIPIIVMSNQGSIPLTVQVMKAGATEFLMKPLADDVVLAAVAQAISRSQLTLQQEADLIELRSRLDSLSHRERQVMARVVAGDLNKQVGRALGISEITVKAHRGRVMRKMGADSLPDLVRMALRLPIPNAPATTPASRRLATPGCRPSQPIRILPVRPSHQIEQLARW